jgi:hypothetical protein
MLAMKPGSWLSRTSVGVLPMLVLAGCVGGGEEVHPTLRAGQPLEIESEAGLVRLEVQPLGAEALRQGDNRLRVRVTDLEGSGDPILTDASAFMPAHGHGVRAAVLPLEAETEYEVADLALFMPGRWEVRLDCRVGALEDGATFVADVH